MANLASSSTFSSVIDILKAKMPVTLHYRILIIAHVIACIYGKFTDLACIIKKDNKNALRLICYNFRTVNAINFLFSTLHTAPFLYGF